MIGAHPPDMCQTLNAHAQSLTRIRSHVYKLRRSMSRVLLSLNGFASPPWPWETVTNGASWPDESPPVADLCTRWRTMQAPSGCEGIGPWRGLESVSKSQRALSQALFLVCANKRMGKGGRKINNKRKRLS